jgi:uncharacterized RDD family membrane protein YckC
MGPQAAEAAPQVTASASMGARISAYLIDSLALVVFLLISFALAGTYLLLAAEQSSGEVSDSAYTWFTAICLGGTFLSWTLFNLALMSSRAQTTGMYFLSLRVNDEDGGRASLSRHVQRWFALHPLLFHPVLLLPWLLLIILLASLDVHVVLFGLALGFAVLCLLGPVVALGTMLVDPAHRALHDRFSHTAVQHVGDR